VSFSLGKLASEEKCASLLAEFTIISKGWRKKR
jgi:hypothetical protein